MGGWLLTLLKLPEGTDLARSSREQVEAMGLPIGAKQDIRDYLLAILNAKKPEYGAATYFAESTTVCAFIGKGDFPREVELEIMGDRYGAEARRVVESAAAQLGCWVMCEEYDEIFPPDQAGQIFETRRAPLCPMCNCWLPYSIGHASGCPV